MDPNWREVRIVVGFHRKSLGDLLWCHATNRQMAKVVERLQQVAGGTLSARWLGFDWEGQVFHNRASIKVPLRVAGAPGVECFLRGKAVGSGADTSNWRFIVLEGVVLAPSSEVVKVNTTSRGSSRASISASVRTSATM